MRNLKAAAILSLILLLSASCRVGAPRIDFWFVDSLIKVFPNDGPGSNGSKAVELWGARNQHVSAQLALRSASLLTEVSAECGPLKNASGAAISSVQVNPVGYVVVATHSEDTPAEELVGEAPGWYPDVLPDFPMEVKSNRTASVWVTIHVPAEAAPGLYRGTLSVRSGQALIAQAEIRLNVVEAIVPKERNLRVTNWLTFADRGCRQFFEASQFSPEWWTLVENVARVMGEHRQSVIITSLPLLIRPYVEGGQIHFDFSNFDRWVEIFRNKGGFTHIEGSHLLDRAGGYNEPLQVSVFLLEKGKVQNVDLLPDDPRAAAALIAFLSALNRHLEEKGWKSIYLQHVLDEPHGSEPAYYAKFTGLIRKHLPGVPTIDAIDADHLAPEVAQNSDIWVPILGRFDNKADLLQQRIKEGHEVWFYTCLFPRGRYMNRLIDFPLIKTRLLHWLNFQQNLTGFLHWGGNYWTPQPMKNTQPVINMNETYLPPGDAFVVYPDKAHLSLYSSIRLEAMREGIEDYELLRSLAQRNPAEARRIVDQAIRSFTEYVRDVSTFRRIQTSLLEAASK
jgi:hypothetical protein